MAKSLASVSSFEINSRSSTTPSPLRSTSSKSVLASSSQNVSTPLSSPGSTGSIGSRGESSHIAMMLTSVISSWTVSVISNRPFAGNSMYSVCSVPSPSDSISTCSGVNCSIGRPCLPSVFPSPVFPSSSSSPKNPPKLNSSTVPEASSSRLPVPP